MVAQGYGDEDFAAVSRVLLSIRLLPVQVCSTLHYYTFSQIVRHHSYLHYLKHFFSNGFLFLFGK